MQIKLRTIPKESKRIILHEQAELRVKCNCVVSQERAALKIIQNWGKIKDFRVNGVPVSKMVEEM
jgi:hypothetical protein